jgi:hypothetical protein
MTNSFDTLIETLLSEMMPATLMGGFGPAVKNVAKKVKELPGKSQHWGPLQKLDPKQREEITTAIIKKVFADNDENTYALAIDNIQQLRDAIISAVKEVAAENPEFKAGSKWAAKFLADRLSNKELLGNVEFTTTAGKQIAKKDVTQKEVKKALNKALEEAPKVSSEEDNVVYRKAADFPSDDTKLVKAFNKLPEEDLKWSAVVSKIGEEAASALKKQGAIIEIVGAEEEPDEEKEIPALDTLGDDDEEYISSNFDRFIDPYISDTRGSFGKFHGDY